MSPVDPAIVGPEGAVGAWHAGLLHAAWPRVRIEAVEAAPGPRGVRVRAVVWLGPLAPADVHVELLPDGPAAPGDPPAAPQPLWSSQAYDDGRFVFEADLPVDRVVRGGWTAQVRPADAVPLLPVRRRLHVAP